MADLLKKTPGLVGLAVCESPHERLRILDTKILDILEQIPKNAAYRKYTEQITNVFVCVWLQWNQMLSS
uniref:NADH dehydrogenase [ubiquinone] 1 alpha subcomplex subunit 5 n=1 Tax=Panthera leo TaxID=9689 RepID=A0A8C9DB20_PANLE